MKDLKTKALSDMIELYENLAISLPVILKEERYIEAKKVLIRSGQNEIVSMVRDDVDNKRLPIFNSRDDFDNQFYDVVRRTINMIHRDISISGNLPLNINDTFMKGEEIGVLFKNNYIFNLVKEKLKETGFELKKEYWTQQRYSGTNYIISDIKK